MESGLVRAASERLRPQAGASAARYYKEARRRWRREMRLTLALTIAICGCVALLIWRYSPWHPVFYAGIIVGGTLALAQWIWDEPPERIAKWGRGAAGERRTAKALRPLARLGWFVRHDIAGRYGNLDHIGVGPSGVFVLDTKNLAGEIAVNCDGVIAVHFELSPIDDYMHSGLPRALLGAARGLRDQLQTRLGWIPDVHAVVVICGFFPQRVVSAGRLTYVAVEALSEWLESQPRRLAPQDQPAVIGAVEQLPRAGDIGAAHDSVDDRKRASDV